MATYRVLRQDDLGHIFVVASRLPHAEAAALVRRFTARGHKQMYWAEMESLPAPITDADWAWARQAAQRLGMVPAEEERPT
jgi:hypothetical protein